jgi:hypothetical protein
MYVCSPSGCGLPVCSNLKPSPGSPLPVFVYLKVRSALTQPPHAAFRLTPHDFLSQLFRRLAYNAIPSLRSIFCCRFRPMATMRPSVPVRNERRIMELESELYSLRQSRRSASARQATVPSLVAGNLLRTMNREEQLVAAQDRMQYNRQRAQVHACRTQWWHPSVLPRLGLSAPPALQFAAEGPPAIVGPVLGH